MVMPDELSCPISFQLMTDPVLADDGYTYQRQAIEEWIKRCTAGKEPEKACCTCVLKAELRVRAYLPGHIGILSEPMMFSHPCADDSGAPGDVTTHEFRNGSHP